jgi:hypothetical protein
MIKKTNKKKVTFYLEAEQIVDTKKLSDKTGLSSGAILRLALKDYLKRNK